MNKAYRVLNQGVRWRVFEKEGIENNFGKIQDLHPFDLESSNIEDGVIFWKLSTEDTTSEELEACLSFESRVNNNHHINPPSGWLNCHAKEACFKIWKDNGISCPNHFEFEDLDDLRQKINNNYPYLIRLNNLSGGDGSYLVKNKEQLESCFLELERDFNNNKDKNRGTKKICVEFIDTKDARGRNSSYRIIVAGEKVITGYARVNQGDHWNVTTSTFSHDFNKFSKDFIRYNELCHEIMSTYEKDIVEAIKLTNNHHVGLDIIRDPFGKIYFIEVQPGYQTGYSDSPGPFYHPSKKDMVQYLLDNKESLERKLPLYYNDWLDKEIHFDKAFKELKRCLDLTLKE